MGKEEIQYLIDTITFFDENTVVKKDDTINHLGKVAGVFQSLRILNEALRENENEEDD